MGRRSSILRVTTNTRETLTPFGVRYYTMKAWINKRLHWLKCKLFLNPLDKLQRWFIEEWVQDWMSENFNIYDYHHELSNIGEGLIEGACFIDRITELEENQQPPMDPDDFIREADMEEWLLLNLPIINRTLTGLEKEKQHDS